MENKDLGTTSMGLQPNLAALLSYILGIITGILFFVLEKDNKFVRFHAMQSIIVFGFLLVLNAILAVIPVIGWVLMPIVGIAGLKRISFISGFTEEVPKPLIQNSFGPGVVPVCVNAMPMLIRFAFSGRKRSPLRARTLSQYLKFSGVNT